MQDWKPIGVIDGVLIFQLHDSITSDRQIKRALSRLVFVADYLNFGMIGSNEPTVIRAIIRNVPVKIDRYSRTRERFRAYKKATLMRRNTLYMLS